MNIFHKAHPGSKSNWVECTDIQKTFSKKICGLISLHVSWVSDLQTCCNDVSKTLPHLFLQNLYTHSRLVVHVIQMHYCLIFFRSGVILNLFLRWIFASTEPSTSHSCIEVDLMEAFFNYFLSKLDIRFFTFKYNLVTSEIFGRFRLSNFFNEG